MNSLRVSPLFDDNWRRASQEAFDILFDRAEVKPLKRSIPGKENRQASVTVTSDVASEVLLRSPQASPPSQTKITKIRFKSIEREEKDLSLEFHPYSMTPSALLRNRYSNVKPTALDLVFLKDGSYINASRFDNLIITQGPFINLENEVDTVGDFWRLAFENGDNLVCLTDPVGGKGYRIIPKTYPYWDAQAMPCMPDPKQPQLVYKSQGIEVRLVDGPKIVVKPNAKGEQVSQRLFEIQMGGARKVIAHWYFENWEDHSVCDPFQLAYLIKLLLAKPGVVIPHCSAGIGRTGVFAIAYKFIREFLQSNSTTPTAEVIDQAVLDLRKRRPGSVQTKEQLDLIMSTIMAFVEIE